MEKGRRVGGEGKRYKYIYIYICKVHAFHIYICNVQNKQPRKSKTHDMLYYLDRLVYTLFLRSDKDDLLLSWKNACLVKDRISPSPSFAQPRVPCRQAFPPVRRGSRHGAGTPVQQEALATPVVGCGIHAPLPSVVLHLEDLL